jgi:hypothetical protein
VPELVVLSGARAGAVFELPEMPTVVGRSPEAHFQLDDPWISSMHAMFERRGADIWVVDLESRNGTYVGGERVQEARLHPGCVLRFGRTEVRLEKRDVRARAPGRNPTPPGVPLSRPTSRLDAPETTGPYRVISDTRMFSEAFPVAPRPVVLLRMALHLATPSSPPDGEAIRGAVEALRGAALNQGGLVMRMGACGVLAVFGAAGPTPDDAEFALLAAREARDAVGRVDAGIALRAAVDGGPVVLGNVSAEGFDLTVLGDVAERTERILTTAKPGEILVGPGAKGAPDLGPARRVRLGGEDVPVARAK